MLAGADRLRHRDRDKALVEGVGSEQAIYFSILDARFIFCPILRPLPNARVAGRGAILALLGAWFERPGPRTLYYGEQAAACKVGDGRITGLP